MFEKLKLRRKIRKLKIQIEELEKKRSRSQSALVDAILSNSIPDDQDVDYFNRYSERINSDRERIRELERKLKETK
ncbi:MAG: hypothetical protein J5781_07110 [Clostridia bacterium]|nr:hypothetical protein [Clostridia bacterium]